MANKCIMSAPTRDELQAMINEYYCSKKYIITEDMKVYNTKTQKTISGNFVECKKSRWRYCKEV